MLRANTWRLALVLIAFVIGPSAVRKRGDDMDATYVGGDEGYSAIALDAATGAEVWRTKF